jgi:hypothetical protein
VGAASRRELFRKPAEIRDGTTKGLAIAMNSDRRIVEDKSSLPVSSAKILFPKSKHCLLRRFRRNHALPALIGA